MNNLLTKEEAMFEDGDAFELMMRDALEEPEPVIPAGLSARLQAWTILELEAQRRATQPMAEQSVAIGNSFKDFGVLPEGSRSRRAFFLSMAMNFAALAVVIFVARLAHDKFVPHSIATNIVAPAIKPVEETPRQPMPHSAAPATTASKPALVQPRVELPPEAKAIVSVTTKPNLVPPSPVHVEPIMAPKTVSLAMTMSAATNSNAQPTAIAIAHAANPSTPAGGKPSSVNLNADLSSKAEKGSTAPSTAVHLGTETQPGSDNRLHGPGKVVIAGPPSDSPGRKGPGDRGVAVIEIAPTERRFIPVEKAEMISSLQKSPVVTFVPTPVYSDEAKAMHLEGDVRVNERLLANGAVQVMGVVSGLGHGLDESAQQAAKGIRFRPATDARGNSVDFTTIVTVHFLHN